VLDFTAQSFCTQLTYILNSSSCIDLSILGAIPLCVTLHLWVIPSRKANKSKEESFTQHSEFLSFLSFQHQLKGKANGVFVQGQQITQKKVILIRSKVGSNLFKHPSSLFPLSLSCFFDFLFSFFVSPVDQNKQKKRKTKSRDKTTKPKPETKTQLKPRHASTSQSRSRSERQKEKAVWVGTNENDPLPNHPSTHTSLFFIFLLWLANPPMACVTSPLLQRRTGKLPQRQTQNWLLSDCFAC